MRTLMTLALATVVASSFGTPSIALAQTVLSSSVAGRAVNASGRGIGSQRVELVRGNLVLSVSTTNGSGDWSFRDVAPGDYVVRMNIGGKIAGVRVSVGTGHAVAGTLIVVPTASVSPQIGAAAAGLITNLASVLPAVAAATVSAGTAVGITTTVEELSPAIVTTIVNSLSPAARVAFAQAVVAAVSQTGTPPSPAVLALVSALEKVIETGGSAPINLS